MATMWRLLLLAAATAVSSTVTSTSSDAGVLPIMSCGAFASSQSLSSSQFCKRNTSSHTLPSATVSPSVVLQSMSKSSNHALQQKIIQGATMKVLKKHSSDSLAPPLKQTSSKETINIIPEGKYLYYVREGLRSEINEIADVLMNSFHPESQPTFDSYIRRYKYNHLRMCFDAIDECDRGLYVACAVPASPSSNEAETERIVGFCSVDGRAPDPSCKIEFLTPSTMAGTSPRPYLSDLGVSTLHRRQGIGEKLVRACEQWTREKGFGTLYLKVEEKNIGALGLYTSMGYKKTKLPWGKGAGAAESRWDTALLLEKSMNDLKQTRERRKRTWIKNQLWNPIKSSADRYSARVDSRPPL